MRIPIRINLKVYSVTITFLFLFSIIALYVKQSDYKWSNIENRAVPRIELFNNLSFKEGRLQGSLSGFVAFNKLEDQPKDLTQYKLIEVNTYSSEQQNSVITAQDVIAFNNLAPRFLEKDTLRVKEESSRKLSLIDNNGNIYEIDKSTLEVYFLDSDGDLSSLITEQNKFRDFIITWLR